MYAQQVIIAAQEEEDLPYIVRPFSTPSPSLTESSLTDDISDAYSDLSTSDLHDDQPDNYAESIDRYIPLGETKKIDIVHNKIGFFIEKPQRNRELKYFSGPCIIQATIQNKLPMFGGKKLIFLDDRSNNTYKLPIEDFLETEGPERDINLVEYEALYISLYETN